MAGIKPFGSRRTNSLGYVLIKTGDHMKHHQTGRTQSPEHVLNKTESIKQYYKTNKGTFYGKKLSKETRARMSVSGTIAWAKRKGGASFSH